MFHKTEGIVLSCATYNDKFSIVHVYTKEFGNVSYLLPRSKNKRSKLKTSLFFPLSVLDLEVEHLPLRDIQRLKEAERQFPLYELCTNPSKISISFFLSDFLTKVLRESEGNQYLFYYLKQSITILENLSRGLANFHIAFLYRMTGYMGIEPKLDNHNKASFFDLMSGELVESHPFHSHFLDKAQSKYLQRLSRINFRNMHLFKLSRADRNIIIDNMITYYRLHVYDFPILKSLEVLRELF
ncbi:MAG: DNA repair protein RecO C-terminal domain-containing protein [Dysgonamonadaceae bacterium]|jgi:DNA repair protein RecO (recombination protein O)|nr:DNA repair protein RecO C-terminal domain-containing protein [Dysgonamonadaceae bacterium]